jgi:hypothetical protein
MMEQRAENGLDDDKVWLSCLVTESLCVLVIDFAGQFMPLALTPGRCQGCGSEE